VRKEAGRMVLHRGHRVVNVPAKEILEEETLRGILREAGLDYLSLLDNLGPPLSVANDATDGD
jgi:hypothetical protein